MLQISLALFACGLSRYMWSINAPVARVIVSFAVLGFLFYAGIVIAGTYSYECPFQTPVSMALRWLRNNWPSSRKITSVVCAAQRRILELLAKLRIVRRGVDVILPINGDAGRRSPALLDGSRSPMPGQDANAVSKQNVDNARCVCWVLRKITDPEAIDSAVSLAGTIRWFEGDTDHDPPYDSVVSTFEACFDSTHRLYPGLRDRAYFSARAILKINVGARSQSQKCAEKYPIPIIPSNPSTNTDPDFNHILKVLMCNFGTYQPILDFPTVEENTHAHLLWVSDFLSDLTGRVRLNPLFDSYESYLRVAVVDHRATIYNILLTWYLCLGSEAKEGIWASHESYVVILPPFPSAY